jgi:hypothetical protein
MSIEVGPNVPGLLNPWTLSRNSSRREEQPPPEVSRVFLDDECAHETRGIVAIHCSLRAQDRNIFFDHSDGALGKHNRHGKERIEVSCRCSQNKEIDNEAREAASLRDEVSCPRLDEASCRKAALPFGYGNCFCGLT